jgi:hypothetical protein
MEFKNNKKYFDDIIENDCRGSFLNAVSGKCFNSCVNKITEGGLNEAEKICVLDCYSKMYYTYKIGNSHSKADI